MRSKKQEKRSTKEGEEVFKKRRSKKLRFERMEDDWGEQRRLQEPLHEESIVEKEAEALVELEDMSGGKEQCSTFPAQPQAIILQVGEVQMAGMVEENSLHTEPLEASPVVRTTACSNGRDRTSSAVQGVSIGMDAGRNPGQEDVADAILEPSLSLTNITADTGTGYHQDDPVSEVVEPTPSSGLKVQQPSCVEEWKKTFVARGTIKNKTGKKFGQGGVNPVSDIRKHFDTWKKIEEEKMKTEEQQPPLQPPPPSQPPPTTPDIPTPTTTQNQETTITPHPIPHPEPLVITTPIRSRKQPERRETPGSKKKKKLIDKKTTKKTKLEDIRRFWRKKDKEEAAFRNDVTMTRMISEAVTMTKSDDAGKFENTSVENTSVVKNVMNVKCEFDEHRVCKTHGCEAEIMIVKISKFKKDIGFYKESVTKLKCSGLRPRGSTESDISSVHILTDPAAPDDRNYSGRDIIDNQKTGRSGQKGGNTYDWRRPNKETDSRVVIGSNGGSTQTLTGEVEQLEGS